jgi:hypothetical protein
MTGLFNDMTLLVIDKLEGGYFHPAMLDDGRLDAKYKGVYGKSGETMFGIDRVAGGNLNNSVSAKKFWKIIDNAGAKSKWKWNYRGGSLESELKELTVEIMYPHYLRLTKQFLSEKSQKIVETDRRLLFHFIYASWNGSGYFQKFAKDINNAVLQTKNKNELANIAIRSRVTSGVKLISLGGQRIGIIFNSILKPAPNYKKYALIFLGVSLASFGAYKTYKFVKNKRK